MLPQTVGLREVPGGNGNVIGHVWAKLDKKAWRRVAASVELVAEALFSKGPARSVPGMRRTRQGTGKVRTNR